MNLWSETSGQSLQLFFFFLWEALVLPSWQLPSVQFSLYDAVGKTEWYPMLPMVWPLESPNIRSIENIRRTLRVNLNRRAQDVHSRAGLILVVKEIVAALSPVYMHTLYYSLSNKIRYIYIANGWISQYWLCHNRVFICIADETFIVCPVCVQMYGPIWYMLSLLQSYTLANRQHC